MKDQPLSNLERQRKFRQRRETKAAQNIAWIEFLEAHVGPEETASLRLEFLAGWKEGQGQD